METSTSKRRFPVLEVAGINLKHNAFLPIAVSAALLFLIPVMVGTANLDKNTSAVPLEMFVSLIGIVMLTPVFQPEQNAEIDDLVSSKYISTTTIYMIRTIYSIIAIALFICIFSGYMSIRDCDVDLQLMTGTLSDAIFLGSLGMITSSICGNTVIGYMIPVVFYSLNYGLGSKLKNYYLFSMTMGNFEPKIWMLITGILLITASVIFRGIRKKYFLNF